MHIYVLHSASVANPSQRAACEHRKAAMPSSATATARILGIGLLSYILGGTGLSRQEAGRPNSIDRTRVSSTKSQFENWGDTTGWFYLDELFSDETIPIIIVQV